MTARKKEANAGQRKALTPTLYIGIGGTGLETLKKLKDINSRIYGHDLKVIRYLSIDSRDNKEKLSPLESTEQLDLTTDQEVKNAGEVLQNLEKHYPHIKSWLPDTNIWAKFKNITQVLEGADQCRALGRFIFTLAVTNKIYPAIQEAISAITAVNVTDMVGETQIGINLSEGPDIFIIGSVCGGTGSGMFLDLAYLCRKIGQERGLNSLKVYGVLGLPELFPASEARRIQANAANAYAALKELNHYTDVKKYSMQYGGTSCEFTEMPPFDHCFLLNTPNEQQFGFGKEDPKTSFQVATSMIADGVFCLSTSPAESSFAEYLTNEMSGQSARVQNHAGTEYPAAFSSFGVASLVSPHQHYRDYCTCRRTEDILDLLLTKSDGPERKASQQKCQEFFNQFKLGEDESARLLKQSVDCNCGHWLTEAKATILSPDGKIKIKEDGLLTAIDEQNTELDSHLSAAKISIEKNKESLITQANDLESYFRKSVNSMAAGCIPAALATINELDKTLTNHMESLHEKQGRITSNKKQQRALYEQIIDVNETDEDGRPTGEIKRLVDQRFIVDLFDWDKREVLGELAGKALTALQHTGKADLEETVILAMLNIYNDVSLGLQKIREHMQSLSDLLTNTLAVIENERQQKATISPRDGMSLRYNVLRQGTTESASAVYEDEMGDSTTLLRETLTKLGNDTHLYKWAATCSNEEELVNFLAQGIEEEVNKCLESKSNALDVVSELRKSNKIQNYIESNLMPASAAYISTNTILDKHSCNVNLLTFPGGNKEIKKQIKRSRNYGVDIDLDDPYTISFFTTKCFFPICSLTTIKNWKVACDLIRERKDNPCYTMRDDLVSSFKDVTPDAKEAVAVQQRAVHAFDLGCMLGFLTKKEKGRVYYYCETAGEINTGFTIAGPGGGRLKTKEWLKDNENRTLLEKLEQKIYAVLSNKTTEDFENFCRDWKIFANKATAKSKKDKRWQTDGQPDYQAGAALPGVLVRVKKEKEAAQL